MEQLVTNLTNWRNFLLATLILTSCQGKDEKSNATQIKEALFSSSLPLPNTLDETFLFQDILGKKPVYGVIPYNVKVPLWSDGARKQRYIFVPPGQKISYDEASGVFAFPLGTTFVKHFSTENDPELAVETRILTLKDDGKWYFAAYIWSKEQRTAQLSTKPVKINIGGQDYRIPSQSECKTCHGDPVQILGFSLKQLNFIDTLQQKSETARLIAEGIFASPINILGKVSALNDPKNTSLTLEQRARSYLEVNCSPCHNPKGPLEANLLDFRISAADTKLLEQGKVVPHKPDESILWEKISGTTNRMPSLSLRPDPLALDIFKAYIEQWP